MPQLSPHSLFLLCLSIFLCFSMLVIIFHFQPQKSVYPAVKKVHNIYSLTGLVVYV